VWTGGSLAYASLRNGGREAVSSDSRMVCHVKKINVLFKEMKRTER